MSENTDSRKSEKLELPKWVSESELYKIQVRQVGQYAMFTLSPEGTLLSWNAGVREILGYEEDEWLGQDASIIFTRDDNGRDICRAEMAMAAEKGFSSDVRWHLRKDGSELFGHGYMTALREPNGTLLGYSKILSDETENKKLQDALTDSNAALEQFAYVASHDLQEPLRTVASFAELLVRKYREQLDDDGRRIVERITAGARRMTLLVQDLLAYARVRTEQDRPMSSSLDEDLETALSQLQTAIEESGAVITHDPLPKIPSDQGQIVRLFQNLVGNALKYRKPELKPEVHIAAKEEGLSWRITIADNGIGFDAKHARDIFNPFTRLHSQDEYSGTGVGLAICRRIVENHGGRIWAESRGAAGATFHFTLPAQGRAPARYAKPVTENSF